MFTRLKYKWKVNGRQLAIVLITFAIGGSLTGYLGKKIMGLLSLDNAMLWSVIYVVIVTLLWPIIILIVSIPMGQFSFFLGYIKKLGKRMRLIKSTDHNNKRNASVTRLAIFASGTGSNAQKIIDHFKNNPNIKVEMIVSNKADAGVLKIASKENIPSLIIEKEKFFKGNAYLNELREKKIDWIILAGFLWKIPGTLINAFPERIVNIHPALLPKFGGKGMYGQKVHETVLSSGEKESGITIHYVDQLYDHGKIILQAKCPVSAEDTPISLAQKVHALEYEYYPGAIEQLAVTKQ